jgi:hypothetical protein
MQPLLLPVTAESLAWATGMLLTFVALLFAGWIVLPGPDRRGQAMLTGATKNYKLTGTMHFLLPGFWIVDATIPFTTAQGMGLTAFFLVALIIHPEANWQNIASRKIRMSRSGATRRRRSAASFSSRVGGAWAASSITQASSAFTCHLRFARARRIGSHFCCR